MSVRDLLIILVVVVVALAVADRGQRFPVVYPGSIVGFLIVLVLVAWLLRW